MKKFLFSAALIMSVTLFAQEVPQTDKVNRLLFDTYKKLLNVSPTEKQRESNISRFTEMENKTNDEELKKMISSELERLKTVKYQDFICFQAKNFNELNLDKKEAKKYEVKSDKFKERTFISPSSTGGSLVYPYLSIDDKTNEACVRMKTTYRSTSWLFVNKMYFILDGEKFEYNFTDPDTNILSGGYITETSDVRVDDYLYSFLKKYSTTTGREEVRYSGTKGVDDINDVLPKTRERITDMVNLIEKIKK